jgi:sialidase-1
VTKDAEHPADLIQLRDGRLLMTFGERNPPRGVHAVISSNSDISWSPSEHIVLASDAPNIDCGYPSSVELERGRIATLYHQVDDAARAPATAKAKLLFWTAPR